MTMPLRTATIPVYVLGLVASLVTGASAAQQVEAERVRVPSAVEIDRSVLAIDVASQRRSLDASIRRALEQRPAADRAAEELRLARAAARGKG
jgi:hypothetical protein